MSDTESDSDSSSSSTWPSEVECVEDEAETKTQGAQNTNYDSDEFNLSDDEPLADEEWIAQYRATVREAEEKETLFTRQTKGEDPIQLWYVNSSYCVKRLTKAWFKLASYFGVVGVSAASAKSTSLWMRPSAIAAVN